MDLLLGGSSKIAKTKELSKNVDIRISRAKD